MLESLNEPCRAAALVLAALTCCRIVAAGYKDSNVQRVSISHHHIDHDSGLVSLISLIWFKRAWHHLQLSPVQIYGPSATQHLVHAAFEYLSVSERIYRARVPALPAVFTGDAGPSDAVAQLAHGADLLVSEVCLCLRGAHDGRVPAWTPREQPATPPADLKSAENFHAAHEHLTPEELGVLGSRSHVKVLLTHYVSGSIHTNMSEFTAGVQKHLQGTVIVGQDLLEYDVP